MTRAGFAFGLLPGWWLSVEDFREFTPLAAPKDWSNSLKASGFSGINLHIYDFPDHRHQMCIRAENPGLSFLTLSINELTSLENASSTIMNILNSGGGNENTFFENDGAVYIPRITEANTVNHLIAAKTKGESAKLETWQDVINDQALTLQCAVPGLLGNLQFQDDALYEKALGPNDVKVRVHVTGPNLLDVMIALGQVIGEAFGQECSGVVTRVGTSVERVAVGDRVCGLLRGTLNTFARGNQWQFVKIPSSIDYPTAEAMPVVYTTAYCGLHDLARLQADETILIHWGAGGVGQAAIQLAKAVGAEVFVTVGSIEKRDFIHQHYDVPLDHIVSSRDLTFVHSIKTLTNGRGVDVILNSSTPQLLNSSTPQLLNRTYPTPPLPLHVHCYSDIQEGFRIMQSGFHTGKLVLKPQEEDLVITKPSRKSTYAFDPEATYLLSGGLGGLGRSAVRWMISRGAKNLILLFRSGIKRPVAQELMEELAAAVVTAAAPQCDFSNRSSLEQVLEEYTMTMPPIKGCIQGSMVLKDTIFSNMSEQDYYTAVRPKVVASRNLHELPLQDMDSFILLSSASGVVGNRGQSNYCIGNTYQDALARHRVSLGLAGVAVDLGMIHSVGFAAENQESMANLRQEGFNAMREDEFLALLDMLCDPAGKYTIDDSRKLQASSVAQIAVGLEAPATCRIKVIPESAWMHDPLSKHLYQIRGEGDHEGDGDGEGLGTSCATLLPAATSLADAAKIVSAAIVQKLCKALSSSERDLDKSKPLQSYGADSLVAVESRAWFMKEVGSNVAVFDIMSGQSLGELVELAARRSSFANLEEEKEAEDAALPASSHFQPNNRPPPHFTKVLGQPVKDTKVVEAIHGTAAKILIQLTYKSIDNDTPTRVCVKDGSNPALVASFPFMFAVYRLESEFYHYLAPKIKIPLPAAIFTGTDTVNGQGLVVLEDLKAKGYTFGNPLQPWPVDRTRASVMQLAALHASTWGDKGNDVPSLSETVSLRDAIVGLVSPEEWGKRFAPDARPSVPKFMEDR
ncbi:polyketide synthase [Fusarium heterosporum]|uniref:Polyketide synthase n=1 Tax=Fusarium heterosporum TaxID=42747 RepID=A0A8H5TLP9_FUSHE|nr:polyketide synthase [Fusarium heterosporum]